MTRGSIQEYTEAVRGRYLRAGRVEKGKILDEYVRVTGYHRKAAIRLLHRKRMSPSGKRRGRRRQYSGEAVDALRRVWESSDRLCSRRLQPFLGEMVRVMCQHGELSLTTSLEAQLCQMSPATIDRLLRPWRRRGGRSRLSTTKPGSLLKNAIPIRTFADWQEGRPGFLEVDLVAHCGESTEGFYLTTLSTVDVASGWSECIGVWGKSQQRVGSAIHQVRQRLPVPLKGLDSDNGSELTHSNCYRGWCRCLRIGATQVEGDDHQGQHGGVYGSGSGALLEVDEEGEGPHIGRIHSGKRLPPRGGYPFVAPG